MTIILLDQLQFMTLRNSIPADKWGERNIPTPNIYFPEINAVCVLRDEVMCLDLTGHGRLTCATITEIVGHYKGVANDRRFKDADARATGRAGSEEDYRQP